MSIVSHVILGVEFPEEAAQRVVEQWAEALKANAERINEKRKAKIPTETEFQARMVQPANLNFAAFVNPAFVTRSGNSSQEVITGHQANLSRSFRKYNERLDYTFATVDGVPAKRFKDLIDIAKEDFSKGIAARSLPMTGTGAEALGPAPLTALWLTGDRKVLDSLRPGDEVKEGGPYLICQINDRPTLKTALNQRLIQSGVAIIKAGLAPAETVIQNDRTNHIVQSLVDPGLGLTPFATGGLSRVDFIMVNGRLYLEIQINQI
jgi:hypothetical protein